MKRIIALLLVCLLPLSILAGCGSRDTKGSEKERETASSRSEEKKEREKKKKEETGEKKEPETAPEPLERRFQILLQDDTGAPVDGVTVNVCTSETCTPVKTEGGAYEFSGEAPEYTVHVLKVPEGYAADTKQEYLLTADAPVLIITLSRSEAQP